MMKQDWEPDVTQAITNLWELAVNLLGEDKARELFVAVTKRGRGKRGPGRNRSSPSKAAARMRRSYSLKGLEGLTIELGRELTEAEMRQYDEYYAARLADMKKK